MYIRRHQMLMENEFPTELKQAYRGMERNGNPWNLSPRDRMKWVGDIEVPTVDDNPDFELLWWVGCAPSYDPRAQETARAFAKVLNAAGVNYAILGEMERCTGDSARRSGNEALFFELAQGNIEVLNEVMGDKTAAHRHHLPALPADARQGIRPVRRQLRGDPPHAVARRTDGSQEDQRAARTATWT